MGEGPLEVAAEAAGLDEHVVQPVADGEALVAAGTLLVAEADLASLLWLPWRLGGCHFDSPAAALSGTPLA